MKLWTFEGGGGITKLDSFWELFLNILWLSIKVKIQNLNLDWELLTFNYFWGYA